MAAVLILDFPSHPSLSCEPILSVKLSLFLSVNLSVCLSLFLCLTLSVSHQFRAHTSSGLQALKEVYNIFLLSPLFYFLLLLFLPTLISVPFQFSFLLFSFLFRFLVPGAC